MKKTKIVKLSGLCETTFKNDYHDDPIEGFIVRLDGKNYAAYRDPNDGYRSYGAFFETEQECTRTFPPQCVLYTSYDEDRRVDMYENPRCKGISLKNIETGEIILDVSTTWYDSYYPIGHCSWNPENLPINQEASKYNGATITIIAEWYRECGDHMIIGKTEYGNYIEGIWSEEGIKFGPITGFQIINS